MKPRAKGSLPNTVPELQQHVMSLIATNRHIVQLNGQLVTEARALSSALGQILAVYRSEDGQALLKLLDEYAAMADAQIAMEAAAKKVRIDTEKWFH